MLVLVPTIYNAQNSKAHKIKSNEASISQSVEEDNIIELFIEIEIEEYYQKGVLRINVNSGKLYESLISDKSDIMMIEELSKEIKQMNNISDLLNYLSEKGFSIVHYSTLTMDDFILNKIIVSQYFIGAK
jgi:hypothetical protein